MPIQTHVRLDRPKAASLAILAAIFVAGPGDAQTDSQCSAVQLARYNRGVQKYRVNIDGTISGVSSTQIIKLINEAASRWNEQTDGTAFVYDGTTTITALKDTESQCQSAGIDYSLIWVRGDYNTNTIDLGVTSEHCIDAGSDAARFRMIIYAKDLSGASRLSWVDDVPSHQHDAQWVLTHEFGHAADLDHPDENGISESAFVSLMRSSSTAGVSRRRSLYQFERHCVSDHLRGLVKRRRLGSSGSWSQTEVLHTAIPFPQYAHVAGGYGAVGNDTGFSVALTLPGNTPGLVSPSNSGPVQLSPITATTQPVHGALALDHWRDIEDEQALRFLWVAKNHVSPNLETSRSPLVLSRSTNGFAGSQYGGMWMCTFMTGPYACNLWSTVPLYSFGPSATALLLGNFGGNFTERISVFAWAEQSRGAGTDGALKLAAGSVDPFTLPVPHSVGFRSRTPPSVVCRESSGSSRACMLAFVEPTDSDFRVAYIRFDVTSTIVNGRNQIAFEPLPLRYVTGAVTTQRMATFYSSSLDKYVVVVRDAIASGQPLKWYSSADLISWTSHGVLMESIVGPTAVAYWRGNENEVVGIY